MNKYGKNLLAVVVCLTVGSVINTGPQKVKNTFKAYAAIYGGYFSLGVIHATKLGCRIQKEWLEIAKKENDPHLEQILTRCVRGNPILEANRLISKNIARTIPVTLPAFMLSSVAYHAYQNSEYRYS